MTPARKRSAGSGVPVVLDPVMSSPAMRAFDRVLRAVAVKEVTVTFVGESGSGKEVMARRLHELSQRRGGPFVPINCAAIPESLFESELFGHERGAFTGATERASGKVEMASTGTLFLDEVAEMPLGLQAKLLRFLETRRYMRVGGTRKLQADVRLALATLRPLELEVRAGRFRADLYYRIQGIVLPVPPLRDRRRDIPLLLDMFIAHLSALHEVESPRLSRSARSRLLSYDWPGNVRELRNVMEMLCILHEGKLVRPHHLPFAVQQPTSADDVLQLRLDRPLEQLVEQIIDTVVAREGNLTRAARLLGLSVRTLQRRRKA
jgi:transcriptional regulator with PAS, ATPase and Fis domain